MSLIVNWLRVACAGCLLVGLCTPSSLFSEKIAPSLLQEDFRIMRDALEEAHGGIYRYTPRAKMDRTFDRAFKKIERPMTEIEFWQLVAPVIAQIKCGHTFISLPVAIQEQFATTTPMFPLEVRLLGGRACVFQDCSNPGSPLEGSELLSINAVPLSKLLKQLRAVFSGDGNTSATKDWRISHIGGFTAYLFALGIQSPFHVIYRDSHGKRRHSELSGMTIPDRQKAWAGRNPAKPDTNADLKFLDDGAIAVLTIRHWYQYADPARKLTFLDFLKDAFARIQENRSRNLIIDVRNNDGGLDAPGKDLFAFLWDRPFHYDTDLVCNALQFDFFKYDADAKPIRADIAERRSDGKFHLVKHPNLGLQQPRQPHFAGKVFALMNGGSFSTSCEFLATLHFHKRGTFIGEEAAGGYYGCTAGRFVHVTLPNSKLILRFGLTTYYQAVSGYKADRGVIPDYPVTYTISDLLANRDKDMELALSLARAAHPQ